MECRLGGNSCVTSRNKSAEAATNYLGMEMGT